MGKTLSSLTFNFINDNFPLQVKHTKKYVSLNIFEIALYFTKHHLL